MSSIPSEFMTKTIQQNKKLKIVIKLLYIYSNEYEPLRPWSYFVQLSNISSEFMTKTTKQQKMILK